MAKWLLVFVLIAARPAFAGDGLDVRDWLSRPGVKLLAVEFYASWCGPCKKAVPQWKALHEKYRDQGLRLVVVSVQDPDGACVNPGWNPDDVICDAEGRLSEAWGVGDKLPAAFLWSWRGPLLVRKGHVQEVERQVEEELARLPRVTLDDGMDGQVRELLRTELARSGKVDVVAGADEEKALAEIRRTSHELQFSDRSACKLGQRLAANSLLKASFVKAGSGKRLLVQLFSAETGCLNASAGVFWNETKPDLSVAEAVAELVNNLRVGVELAGGAGPATVKEREIGERAEGWELEGTSGVIVAFETEPTGAVVLLDGKVLCMSSPCSKLVAPGSHKVEFQLESYLPVRESVTVTERTGSVKRTLTPDFGWLTVRSKPAGLGVTLDGKPWGTTPVQRRQVSSGPHRVLVSDLRYFDKGKEIVVDRGEHEEVDVELSAREGGLQVHARDRRGNDLRATVLVDGREMGNTPFSGKVMVGDHRVRVVQNGESWEKNVTVREKQVEKLDAVLDIGDAVPVPEPERSGTGDRKRLFHLGLSLAEGVVFAGDSSARSSVSGTLSTWLKWGWFRWEPVSVGVSFEGANAVTLGTGACWDIAAGFYLRTLIDFAFADGASYSGFLGGAGYGFDLGKGWRLDAEVDATFWPGDILVVPLEARLGVRYGF
jgi:thiol-disulfide isomerase/thioredoxin